MTVCIKSFGHKALCSSIEELKGNLVNRFSNSHVTIVDTVESGIRRVWHVSVDEYGVLRDTYRGDPVALTEFRFEAEVSN
jgi:hypothetical protein